MLPPKTYEELLKIIEQRKTEWEDLYHNPPPVGELGRWPLWYRQEMDNRAWSLSRAKADFFDFLFESLKEMDLRDVLEKKLQETNDVNS